MSASPDVSPYAPILGVPYSTVAGLSILNATGCLPEYLYGDQTKTQQAIARLLVQSQSCLFEDHPGENVAFRELAQRIWNALRLQYAHAYDSEAGLVTSAWNQAVLTQPTAHLSTFGIANDQRTIPSSALNSFVSPFTAYHDGIDLRPNYNMVVSARGAFSLGEWFDLDLEPLLTTNTNRFALTLQSGMTKLSWRDFEFKLGRSATYWGQGDRGRMLFSGNAEPLEMVQVGSPYPFRLPWIFKHLGPSQYRLFVSLLDEKQIFDHSFLLGATYLFKPHPTFEIGVGRAVIFGGNGAPHFLPFDPLLELIGIRRDGFIFHIPVTSTAHNSAGIANNLFSIDFRWRWPWARNTELFVELFSDDAFWNYAEDGAVNAGVWIPRLSAGGKWQLLCEGTKTQQIPYTHSVFRSGYTENRHLIGTELGPEGLELHLWQGFLLTKNTKLWSEMIYQKRSRGPVLDLMPAGAAKNEQRDIAAIGLTQLINDRLRTSISGALQYIQNFNNIIAQNKTLGSAELSFAYIF